MYFSIQDSFDVFTTEYEMIRVKRVIKSSQVSVLRTKVHV